MCIRDRERALILKSFIQILNQLPTSFPDLHAYIEEKNEENDWQEAQKKNNIEGYKFYFEKYPNGKYKSDTLKLIAELEDLKAKQEIEIKRLALMEKERRDNDKSGREPYKPVLPSPSGETDPNSNNQRNPLKSKKGMSIRRKVAVWSIIIIVIIIIISSFF